MDIELDLDDELLARARAYTGIDDVEALIHEALRALGAVDSWDSQG